MAGTSFQSPFHRVNRCNRGSPTRRCTLMSSFQSPFHRVNRCNYNSLARGEVKVSFQSPFHRVNRCNVTYGKAAARICESFSPLFIGSIAVTHRTESPAASAPASFSPLFIGSIAVTTSRNGNVFRTDSFQSPFHRVNCCNYDLQRELPDGRRRFQSPFHRVNCCNMVNTRSVL